MRKWSLGLAITAFALLAAMGGLLMVGDPPETDGPSSREVKRAAFTPHAPPPTLGEADRLAGRADLPLPTVRAAVQADGSDSVAATTPPGFLRFEWAPPDRGDLEDAVEARVMSDLRFAEQQVETGVNTLPLTPGHYEVSIHTTGYDPVDRVEVSIVSGETTDLGKLQFVPGVGVIEGYVSSATHLSGAVVELVGDGRHPCRYCGQHSANDWVEITNNEIVSSTGPACATCGYADERSIRTVDASGRFRFGNLSGGAYRVRARHSEAPVPAEQVVLLRPSGHAFASLTIPTTTPLEVQLVPSAALIEAGGAIDFDGSPVEFRFKRVDADNDLGSIRLAAAAPELAGGPPAGVHPSIWTGAMRSVTFSAGTLSFNASPRGSSVASMQSHRVALNLLATRLGSSSDLGVKNPWVIYSNSTTPPEPVLVAIDRPRLPTDSLQVAPSQPEQETISLSGKWIGPDRALIEGLPRELLMGQVRAGSGISPYTSVDLRFGNPPMHAAVLSPYPDGDGDRGDDWQVIQRIGDNGHLFIELQSGQKLRVTSSPTNPSTGSLQIQIPSQH